MEKAWRDSGALSRTHDSLPPRVSGAVKTGQMVRNLFSVIRIPADAMITGVEGPEKVPGHK